MAKIISPVWSQIRGSIAGTTYFNSPSGAIIGRARVRPVNPNSTPQNAIRSAFQTAISTWGNILSPEIRHGWDAWARTVFYTGPYGTYNPSGRQMYIAVKTFHAYCQFWIGVTGGTPLPPFDNVAPTRPGLLSLDNLNVSTPPPTGAGFIIGGTNRSGETVNLFGWRSGAFPAARNYPPQIWLQALSWQDATLQNNTSGQVSWTDCVEDYAYFGAVRLISAQSPFRISQKWVLRAIAESAGE